MSEPAFPTKIMTDEIYQDEHGYKHRIESFSTGMSLRDYFAAKAMQAGLMDWKQSNAPLSALAERCYEVADAMLAERGKKNERA